jgi:SAM-dependent methyltransferase
MNDWWDGFFDADYLYLWEKAEVPEKTEQQVAGLWKILGLESGSKVLDAPCGYGRISYALAKRGAQVLGLDQSQHLLAEAQQRRGDMPANRLQYLRHDLRIPLPEKGFDVALNIFSSLGYGSEAEDVTILSNLRAAIRPGGAVFIDTMHLDLMVAKLSKNSRSASRLPDGTLLVEEPGFDPISGRIETTWYWNGPKGSGQKCASLRVYTATEMVKIIEASGLQLRSAHNGCSTKHFVSLESAIERRLGILAIRE